MFKSLTGNYREWRKYRNTVNELSYLSKRELDDMGISRSDIESIARGTFGS